MSSITSPLASVPGSPTALLQTLAGIAQMNFESESELISTILNAISDQLRVSNIRLSLALGSQTSDPQQSHALTDVQGNLSAEIRFSCGRIVGDVAILNEDASVFTSEQTDFLHALARFAGAFLEKQLAAAQAEHNQKPVDAKALAHSDKVPLFGVPLWSRGTALLFDDTFMERQPIAAMLQEAGYRVVEIRQAATHESIMIQLKVHEPSLLVIAASEPDDQSAQALQQFNTFAVQQHYTPVPTIFLAQSLTARVQAYIAGATVCLPYRADPRIHLREFQKTALYAA